MEELKSKEDIEKKEEVVKEKSEATEEISKEKSEEIVEEKPKEEEAELAADPSISLVINKINAALRKAGKLDDVKDIIDAVKKELLKAVPQNIKSDKVPQEKSAKLSSGEQDLYDEMYAELEKSVTELKQAGDKIQFLEEQITDSKDEKETVEKDVKAKEEIIKIKEKQLSDIEQRISQIEDEKKKENDIVVEQKINNIVEKYLSSGLIDEDKKVEKFNELKNMSDDALNELSGVIDRKLETTGERVIQTSEELKEKEETVQAETLSKPRTREEKLDELFSKLE